MINRLAYIVSQFPEMHETFILREMLEIKKKGVDITIFSLKNPNEEIVHRDAEPLLPDTFYSPFLFSKEILAANLYFLLNRPVRYIHLILYLIYFNSTSLEYLFKTLYILPKSILIAKVIKDRKIEHVHAHWATIPTTVALAVSRLTGVPFSFTAHAWDIYWKPSMLAEKSRRASLVVTCTEANRRHLEHVLDGAGSADRVFVNYHGIDLSKFDPEVVGKAEDGGGFKLLAIGRFVKQKGFDHLLRACRLLKERGLEFSCLIIGDGPERGFLEGLVRELDVSDRLTLGKRMSQEELLPILNASDVLVVPSVIAKNNDRDGIPNVIMEAMALGVPVVGTNVSGLPEIIKDGETGLVVPAGDDKAIADAIEVFYGDEEMRKRCGAEGRRFVARNFNIEKNVEVLVRRLLG